MKKIIFAMLVTVMSVCIMLSVAVSAADFTPSVENKPAPDIVTDDNGNVATIHNQGGVIIFDVTSGQLIVTPVSSAQDAEDTEMAEKLLKAYNELSSSNSLGDVCDNLPDVLAKINANISEQDLVIRDLFDVSVYGDASEHLSADGNYISVNFNLGLKPNDFIIALHYGDNGWEALDPDNVKINNDGIVTVKLYSLSPIAFVVNSSESGEVISPPTSDSNTVNWLAVCAVSGVMAAVFFVLYSCERKAHSK